MHDLNAVAVPKYARTVIVAGDDLAIQFDRDPSLVESELADQIGDRQAFGEPLWFAVDDHVHTKNIMISGYLYNLGAIW